MKTAKYGVIAAITFAAIGLGVHRGMSQTYQNPVPNNSSTFISVPYPFGFSYNTYTPDFMSGGIYNPATDTFDYPSQPNYYNCTFGPNDIPRTSDSVSTKLVGSTLQFKWEGEQRAIDSIRVALLDKNNAVVTQSTIVKAPATINLKKTVKSTGYSVKINYINGTTTSITSPL